MREEKGGVMSRLFGGHGNTVGCCSVVLEKDKRLGEEREGNGIFISCCVFDLGVALEKSRRSASDSLVQKFCCF